MSDERTRRDVLAQSGVVVACGLTAGLVGRNVWQAQREALAELREECNEEYGEGDWRWQADRTIECVPTDSSEVSD